MKNRNILLLVLALAAVGCTQESTSTDDTGNRSPDWEHARQQLNLSPEDIAAGTTVEERGAKPSETLTVGDTISVQYNGWIYSWRVKPSEGEVIVLEKLEATRIGGIKGVRAEN